MSRRLAALLAAVAAVALASPGRAAAHPLGNFTLNHLTEVSVSSDAVDVHYVLDQAEIPTFQERRLSRPDVLGRKRAEVLAGLRLVVDGRPVGLHLTGPGHLTQPPGQGGLPLTRVELDLRAAVRPAHVVRIDDRTFAGRIGWTAVRLLPGRGTAVRSADAYSTDPTGGLRRYPLSLLDSPLHRRAATLTVAPGAGSVDAPPAPGGQAPRPGSDARDTGGDGFAGVFADAAAGRGVLLFLLLAAFAWGALHALSPGHGKAMVAAYLVGARGRTRHAVALGAIVTVTHTMGVFALGFVTLGLSQWILPEDLYPWLNLTAGLMVVVVGLGVLRSRLRARRGGGHAHDRHPRGHHDHHAHDHHDHHAHDHHDHHGHDHHHDDPRGHTHLPPRELTWRGLLAMGAAAGLIPCPSALVVLLGAIAQHEVALGLLLIVAFSLGLAGTLTALGLIVVHSRARMPSGRLTGHVTAALPSISAVVILVAGSVLTLQAIPQLA